MSFSARVRTPRPAAKTLLVDVLGSGPGRVEALECLGLSRSARVEPTFDVFSAKMPAVGPQMTPKSKLNRRRTAARLVKACIFPARQARIVQLLVERDKVQENALEVRIRAAGLASLVAELRQRGESMAP